MSEYEQQAQDFLAATGTLLEVKYLYTGPYFAEDKEHRDVYEFTLKNARGQYSAKFGDSIHNTERRQFAFAHQPLFSFDDHACRKLGFDTKNKEKLRVELIAARNRKPGAYDILACLTKYDPGMFSDFCAEMGYDTDSRKAEKTYFAAQEEWNGVRRLFTSEQLEQLAEIN